MQKYDTKIQSKPRLLEDGGTVYTVALHDLLQALLNRLGKCLLPEGLVTTI